MKHTQPTEQHAPMPHLLTLSERAALTVSGVTDIDSFDESTVLVYTSLGDLTVKGRNLRIQRLSIESGDLVLEGEIESLTYAENRARSGGFFTKLFR